MKFFKGFPSLLVFALSYNALIFLSFRFKGGEIIAGYEGRLLWRTLAFTLYQGFLSSLFSIVIGLMAAAGYSRLGKLRYYLRWILLFPNLMSSVFVILCLILSVKNFPYGIWGIIIGHVFMNGGLATVWLGERFHQLEREWLPVAAVMGVSRRQYYFRVILPQLLPQVWYTFSIIFSLCVSSFAIPLVLGGGPQASTLEVLMYETISTQANVTWASTLGLIQGFFPFLLFYSVFRHTELDHDDRVLEPIKMELSSWTLLTLIPFFISFFPIARFFIDAISSRALVLGLLHDQTFLSSILTSLEGALCVGLLTFSLLALLAGWGWKPVVARLPALSGVVVGLAGFLLFRVNEDKHWIYILALTWGHMSVIFLPVFRLAQGNLKNLRLRYERVITQLGVGSWFAFRKVYLKLGMRIFVVGSSLAASWSMGEFSIAKTLGFTNGTLPMYVEGLLGRYRLEEAIAGSCLFLIIGFLSLTSIEILMVETERGGEKIYGVG